MYVDKGKGGSPNVDTKKFPLCDVSIITFAKVDKGVGREGGVRHLSTNSA